MPMLLRSKMSAMLRSKATKKIQTATAAPRGTSSDKTKMSGEETREKAYKDKVCIMCSTREETKRHHHFSTTQVRRAVLSMNSSKSDSEKMYMCSICATLEPYLILSYLY